MGERHRWHRALALSLIALLLCPTTPTPNTNKPSPSSSPPSASTAAPALPSSSCAIPNPAACCPCGLARLEAQAIAFALHGVIMPRPMTHDLMASLISELRAEVEEVVVTDLRLNTYFAVVRLRVRGERRSSRRRQPPERCARAGASHRFADSRRRAEFSRWRQSSSSLRLKVQIKSCRRSA